MYDTGQGVPEDDATAGRWYRLTAEQRNTNAQFYLGGMYSLGTGVPEDAAQAVQWVRLAAERSHVRAQAFLGLLYANGKGVRENASKAYAWYSIAAAQGNTTAKESKKFVTKRMTRSQIAEAQELSREYWTLYVLPFQ